MAMECVDAGGPFMPTHRRPISLLVMVRSRHLLLPPPFGVEKIASFRAPRCPHKIFAPMIYWTKQSVRAIVCGLEVLRDVRRSGFGECGPHGRIVMKLVKRPSYAPTKRVNVIVLAVFACVLSLSRHLPFIADDFDGSFDSCLGSYFQGPIQKAYLEQGFISMGGRPLLDLIPAEPIEGLLYVNHPPFFSWCTYAFVGTFGLRTWTLRIFPILCSALMALFLAHVAAKRIGVWGAIGTIVFWTFSPMVFFFGDMANYESTCLLISSLALFLVGEKDYARRKIGYMLFFLATFIDWPGGLFALASILVTNRKRWMIRPIVAAGLGPLVAVGTCLTLTFLWEPSFDLQSCFDTAVDRTQFSEKDSHLFANYFPTQWAIWRDLFGYVPSAVYLCLVASCLRRFVLRTATVLHAAILSSMFVSLAYVFLFPANAYYHEFWWYYSLLGVALSMGIATQFIANRHAFLAVLFLLASSFMAPSYIMDRYQRDNTGKAIDTAAIYNRNFDKDTLILMSMPREFPTWAFSVDAWVNFELHSTNQVREYVGRFKKGELKVNQIVVCFATKFERIHRAAIADAFRMGGRTIKLGDQTAIVFRK